MEGAKLFLYDSSNVRRPADFITSLSDRTGRVQIALPPGNYWIVARFKSDGKYGPLMPGDKHSGEPLEVDMKSGGSEVDFVVADIRELGQKKRAGATDALRLKGRVVDANGVPVAKVFVFAAGIQAGYTWLVVVGIINSIVGVYYYLNVMKYVYLYRTENEDESKLPIGVPKPYTIALVVLIIGVILIGTIFAPWFDISSTSAMNLF